MPVQPVDNTPETSDRLQIIPWDIRSDPILIPTKQPFDFPRSTLCLNYQWWAHIAGLLDRLCYIDAWQTDDPEEAQAAINDVLSIIATIGKFKECSDVPTNPYQDPCCPPGDLLQIIDQSTSQTTINNSWSETVINDVSFTGELSVNFTLEQIAKQIGDAIVNENQICVASTVLLYALYSLGEVDRGEAWTHGTVAQLIHKIFDIAVVMNELATLITALFPGTQLAAPLFAMAAFIATWEDDLIIAAVAELLPNYSREQMDQFACEMHEVMQDPSAGYAEFAGIDFGDEGFNSLWADLATPELYGAWIALLDNRDWNLDITCCTNCQFYYPGNQEIEIGYRLPSDPRFAITQVTGTDSSRDKVVKVKVNFPEGRVVRKFSVWAAGKRYSNTGIDHSIKIDSDVHPPTEAVHYDGSAWVNNDLNEPNVYFAPPSMVAGAQPQTTAWSVSIKFGDCTACSTSQLVNLDNSFGVLFGITICWE